MFPGCRPRRSPWRRHAMPERTDTGRIFSALPTSTRHGGRQRSPRSGRRRTAPETPRAAPRWCRPTAGARSETARSRLRPGRGGAPAPPPSDLGTGGPPPPRGPPAAPRAPGGDTGRGRTARDARGAGPGACAGRAALSARPPSWRGGRPPRPLVWRGASSGGRPRSSSRRSPKSTGRRFSGSVNENSQSSEPCRYPAARQTALSTQSARELVAAAGPMRPTNRSISRPICCRASGEPVDEGAEASVTLIGIGPRRLPFGSRAALTMYSARAGIGPATSPGDRPATWWAGSDWPRARRALPDTRPAMAAAWRRCQRSTSRSRARKLGKGGEPGPHILTSFRVVGRRGVERRPGPPSPPAGERVEAGRVDGGRAPCRHRPRPERGVR